MKATKSTGKNSPATSTGNAGVKPHNYRDPATDLKALFVEGLKDMYWTEKALTRELPKMSKKASSEELSEAIDQHLEETEKQVKRLEKIFSHIGKTAQGKKCEAMVGLIKEAEQMISEATDGIVRDATIIAGAQKVEHYEIASYGTLRAYAGILGYDHSAELLQESLNEEKDADSKLTGLAMDTINVEASEMEE